MPAYPTAYTEYDFQNAATYPGTGNTIYDLQAANVDLEVAAGTWVSGSINYWNLLGNTNIFNGNPGATFQDETFTVTCWYYPNFTNPSNYATVWSMGTDGNSTRPLLATESNGTMNIQWSFGFAAIPYTPTIDWHMFTFVSTGTGGSTTLYVDGQYVGTNAQVGTIGGNALIRLGAGNNGSNNPWEYAYGRIGYWSYHTTALTPTNILDQYNSTKIKFDNIIYSYDFSDPACYPGSGSTVFDLSGSEYDLAISGSPTFGGTGQSKYFEFNGNAANYISTAATGGLGDTFSANIWFQFDTTGSVLVPWAAGLNNNASGNAPFFTFNYLTAGSLKNGFNYGVSYAESDPLSINTWYMATSTFNGTTNKLYVNGIEVDSISQSTGSWPSGGFVIGQNINSSGVASGQEMMDGKVAKLEIFDTTLSAGEVSTIFTNESSRFGASPLPYQGIAGGRQFAQGFNG